MLLLAYACFGWQVSTNLKYLNLERSGLYDKVPSFSHWLWLPGLTAIVWLLAIVYTLLMTAALTTPLFDFGYLSVRFLKSKGGAFIGTIFAPLLVVVALFWVHIFSTALVLVAAKLLMKFDLQTTGFKRNESFALTAFFSLAGLGLGGAANYLFQTG